MSFTSAYATSQTEVGIAIEATRGTPVAPAFWIPVKAPAYKPNVNIIEDTTLQGSMVSVYDLIPGQRYDGHGWNAHPYLDSFPVFCRALLGSTDNLVVAPANTTLASSCVAGAASITLSASVAAGSYVVLDNTTPGLLETVRVKTITTSPPWTATLVSPTIYAHASAATVTGLTKHQFSLLNNAGSGNQPPSVTITDFAGDAWRQIPASQLDKLTIKATADQAVTYDCSWLGNPAITPSTPTPAYTTTQAPAAWTTQVLLGGNQVTYYMDYEYDLGRGTKPIPAYTGTQAYYQYFAGPIAAQGKVTVLLQSGATELTDYENGTQTSFEITFFDRRTGDACTIRHTTAMFRSGELDRGKEWVQVPLDFTAIPNATDALAGGVSPVLVTVANAQAASY